MQLNISRFLLMFLKLSMYLYVVSADTYNVNIGIDKHVNVIDSKFLSFTVDPKFLFSSNEKYKSKESVCMASSLTPAYIQIAGTSTIHMTFQNTTISIQEQLQTSKKGILNHLIQSKRMDDKLEVTLNQWKKFLQWTKSTGFDLVFALNNYEKTESGMWDPNTALKILTVAEKAGVEDIFWQLGYECANQSIEEYLNDLQTLRVIVETFPRGKEGTWRVVGGDVTNCLQEESKSDFKDYVILSNDMMDAVLLNGNSSAQELERMSELDRLKLLKFLSRTDRPLWLTEHVDPKYNELERAADWMASLGYSARNGFAVHFRELLEEELYEPTLSFYMALLYKNLVGDRVLSVDLQAPQTSLFAHCTSLRHEPVPGAITLFGANMDNEPARFSLKLSNMEGGGDIMQFIFGHDLSGNIIVNGRPMYHAGDIKPVVKRVRPYKTLLINLSAKSFGFWVLANTKIDACQYEFNDTSVKQMAESETVTDEATKLRNNKKVKRSIRVGVLDEVNDVVNTALNFENTDNVVDLVTGTLKSQISNVRNGLRRFIGTGDKSEDILSILRRGKRQAFNEEIPNRMNLRRHHKSRENKKRLSNEEKRQRLAFVDKFFQLYPKLNTTRKLLRDKITSATRQAKGKLNKKDPERIKLRAKHIETINETDKTRNRRSITDSHEDVSDNEIEYNKPHLENILKMIHKQLIDLPEETEEEKGVDEYVDKEENKSKGEDFVEVKSKVFDDDVVVDYSEETTRGIFKSTFNNILSVLKDLNRNLTRFWNTLGILE